MRVAWAFTARHTEQLADGTLGAFGIGIDIFTMAELPQMLAVPVVVSLTAPFSEAAQHVQQQLRLSILGPDLAPVVPPIEIGVGMQPGPHSLEGWDVRTYFSSVMVFEVAEAGTYSIELAAGGTVTSLPIIVNHTPDPAEQT